MIKNQILTMFFGDNDFTCYFSEDYDFQDYIKL